jgi:hypothetical protein
MGPDIFPFFPPHQELEKPPFSDVNTEVFSGAVLFRHRQDSPASSPQGNGSRVQLDDPACSCSIGALRVVISTGQNNSASALSARKSRPPASIWI